MNDRPVALITGAAGGIGIATARAFAQRGYDLALLDLPATAAALGELATELANPKADDAMALVLPADLADPAAPEAAIAAVAARFGRLDVLVNNAAWRETVSMRQITPESWARTLQICLTAPAFLARHAAALMEPRRAGVILNISSINALQCTGLSPAYVVAKGGLDALTRELAVLYGPAGIRVVGISLGAVDTAMSRDYTDPEGDAITEALASYSHSMTPLGRWASPAEVAAALAMLASPDAAYLTGTSITLDGGWHVQHLPHPLLHRLSPADYPAPPAPPNPT